MVIKRGKHTECSYKQSLRDGEVCWACLISMHAGQVDPRGKTWNRLRASIGQPNFIDVEAEETPEEQADTVKEEESFKVPQMS